MEASLLSERLRVMVQRKLGRSPILGTQNRKGATHTGTVIVALKYKDGVILAADRQTSSGDKIFSSNSNKIRKLGMSAGIGSSGLVCMIQIVYEIFGDAISEMELTEDELSSEGQLKIFKLILQNIFLLSGGFTECAFLVAGIDPKTKNKFIVEFDEGGASYSREKFTAIGSGTDEASTILEEYLDALPVAYLQENEASEIAVRAVHSAKRDVKVGDARTSPPLVILINKTGYHVVEDGDVKKIVKNITSPRTKLRRKEVGI